MKKDAEVQLFMQQRSKGKTQVQAANRAGMSERTARKYEKVAKLPSQIKQPRQYRTRTNPFEQDWDWVVEQLQADPALQATTLFTLLSQKFPGRYLPAQVRTLQRHISNWRTLNGPEKEVYFPQVHQPGEKAQSDFTHMTSLGITLKGEPFSHLLFHFVLTYSNVEAVTVCFSETFEALAEGIEHALWQIGGVPLQHRTDHLSAAIRRLDAKGREDFTQNYQALMAHYGMQPTWNNTGEAHENGDVEQSHYRFKEALDQALRVRGARDFTDRVSYERFIQELVRQRNITRQKRFVEGDKANNQEEYVLAFNNAKTAQTATFATYHPNSKFQAVYPFSNQPQSSLSTNGVGEITVTVPPLSFVIYKTSSKMAKNDEAPGIRLTTPTANQSVSGRVEVAAELDSYARPTEVTFAVKVGNASNYKVIGTDNNAPYRVFYDTSSLPANTPLTFKAIANDTSDDRGASLGDINSTTISAVAVPKRQGQVTFSVTVPANTPASKSVYIAGELPNLDPTLPAWNPGGVVLTKVDATHWTVTLSGEEGTTMEYKYALGSWDFGEKDAACNEIANRHLVVTFGATTTQTINDTVAAWNNVPPCGGATGGRQGQVTFNLTVPANTPASATVSVAGTLSQLDSTLPDWTPGAVVLTKVDATHWTLTINTEEGKGVDYKYTLGSWDTVEKNATCGEVANRHVTVTFGASSTTQAVNDTVANWTPCT